MQQSNRYLEAQPNGRRTSALIIAALLHVLLIYGLISGLGRKVIEVMRAPVEATIIQAVKPPLPPPPPPPPPKATPVKPASTPPAFVPPPEVKISTAPVQNTITAVVAEKPLEQAPLVIQKPIEAPAVNAKPAPAAPKPRLRAGVNPIYRPPVEELLNNYPPRARREGISGRVQLRLTISPAGEVINVLVRDAQPKKLFDRAAAEYVQKFKFEKGEDEFEVDQVIEFHAE